MTTIIVTGSGGHLGTHLMAHLHSLGYDPYGVPSRAYDLRREAHLDALFKHVGKPDIIFHLAANVGGIQYNIDNPGAIYYSNVMMTTQLIHKAMVNGCGKFVMIGSACSYPKVNPLPTPESRLWQGYPEPTNGPYGIAKLVALAQLQAYHTQYGFNFAYPILANLYGPGARDDSHVIPALIKRFLSKPDKITIWGDGSPTRDFLYVTDAAQALARFIEVDYNQSVNIASGQEVSIRRVVELLTDLSGYTGLVEYDTTRPNGQLRRAYDVTLAQQVLGWQATTQFEDGLKETYANYCNDQR